MKVVIASTNPAKLREFSELSAEAPWLELVLAPPDFSIPETGSTFFENARIKAVAAARLTGSLAAADDSGLVVEALEGRPGIHSSRYCPGTDADRRAHLLSEMAGVPEDRRQAAFLCAMVVANPDTSVAFSVIRAWEGVIATAERGTNGFGYDSLFYLPALKCTSAELPPAEKNRLSHRGQAWRAVVKFLASLPSPHPA